MELYPARSKMQILDSESDVSDLPKSSTGSFAVVAAGGKAFMVNASGSWVEFGTASAAVSLPIGEEMSF